MQRDRSGGLQELPVDGTKNPNIVIRAGGGTDDAVVLIDHLHELADNERNRLDPLDLLLSAEELALQILLLIFHVFLLNVDELQLSLQRLQAAVEVVVVGGLVHRATVEVRSGARKRRRGL